MMPICDMCGRARTDKDAYDYNPLQVFARMPLGWYSGNDGEFCGDCMAALTNRANR